MEGGGRRRWLRAWPPVRIRIALGTRRRRTWPRLRRFRPDARRVLAPPSDAVPVAELRVARDQSTRLARRLSMRRGTVGAVLALVFLSGIGTALFATRGYFDVAQAREELAALRARVEAQQDKVVRLKREVQRLREEPAALERIAREELGMAKPGEVTFLLPVDRRERERRGIPGAGPPP